MRYTSGPSISATGGDVDVGITLTTKGSGNVIIAEGDLMLGQTAVTATAAELNILDASATTPGTTTVAGGHGIIMEQDEVTTSTTVATLDTYLASTTKTLANKTLTAPVIVDGDFIADAGRELVQIEQRVHLVDLRAADGLHTEPHPLL